MNEAMAAVNTDPGSGRSQRRVWFALGVLLVVHVVLAWLIREPGITSRNDDGVYLLLSRAVRLFQYRSLYAVDLAPHTQYPPGYPVFLAGLTLLFGEHIDLFLAAGTLCSAIAVGLVFDVLRRRTDTTTAFLVIVPTAINCWLLRLAGTLIAEPVYLLVSALALWLLERDASRPRTAGGTAAGLVGALVRSVGVMLPAAIGLSLLSRRQWRQAALVAVASAAVLGPWFVWVATHPAELEVKDRSYLFAIKNAAANPNWHYLPRRLVVAKTYLVHDLPLNLPMPRVETTLRQSQWGPAAAVLILVGLLPLWRRLPVAATYLALYCGLLLLWTADSPRFVSMVVPLLIAALILGTQQLFRRAPPWVGRAAVVALSGGLALGSLREWRADRQALTGCDRAHALEQSGCYNEEVRTYFVAATRMSESVPPDAGVLAMHEASVAYLSDRLTAAVSTTSADMTSTELLNHLARNKVDYVLLGHTRTKEIRWLAPRLLEQCGRLDQLLWVAPHAFLFRVRSPGEGSSDRIACRSLQSYLADPPRTAPQRP
jgi:hypothetical protein